MTPQALTAAGPAPAPVKAGRGVDEQISIVSEHAPASQKRKKPEKGGGFKVVGTLVLAMRRFQASINPTVSFGKRPTPTSSTASSNSSGSKMTAGDGEAPTSGRAFVRAPSNNGRPGGAQDGAGVEKKAPQFRGHRTSFLLRSLPEIEQEQ